MEPQWNPKAEEQALDRVYRLGQLREVIATRYLTRNSIEEVRNLVQTTARSRTDLYQKHVLRVQRQKLDMISLTFSEGSEHRSGTLEVSKLTAETNTITDQAG